MARIVLTLLYLAVRREHVITLLGRASAMQAIRAKPAPLQVASTTVAAEDNALV